MMIVSAPKPTDTKRNQRFEMVIWSILCVQVLEMLALIALLVRR